MKVCLIYVGVGVAGFSAGRPVNDREGGWIGHGVASVGAALKDAGHDVSLIDLRQLAGWNEARETIALKDADVFGLSVSAVDHGPALSVARIIREEQPHARIMAGGIHPTLFPGQYGEHVDCVVTGEGEVTARMLLELDEWPQTIQGDKPDLDRIAWVDRELFQYWRELTCNFAPGQRTPSVTMLAGRGCAYRCNYCQPAENAVFGHPYRLRSADNVVEEIAALSQRYNARSVTFWDDTFTFRASWVYEFCTLYERLKLGLPIVACSRADIICKRPEMIQRMAAVGVDWLVIGLETGSQRLLNLIDKGTTVEENREAVRICKNAGIKTFATVMFGLPTETKKEALATVAMLEECKPEMVSPFNFTPIPGTGLHDYCEENDLILPHAKNRTIERTGVFARPLRGINYEFLDTLTAQAGPY